MSYSRRFKAALLVTVTLLFSVGFSLAGSQRKPGDVSASNRDITILVTAHAHNERMRAAAQKLKPDDFAVREDGRPQQIVSVKSASQAQPVLAILIQDDLVAHVNNDIGRIRKFILALPEGSSVMTGYITTGTLQVKQDFTTQRERAAESLRIIRSSTSASPYNPYIEVIEALRRFDSQPAGRRMILLISDGLDTSHGFRSASPMQSIDLDRAIREAQRRGVAVFSMYAPSVGLTSTSRI